MRHTILLAVTLSMLTSTNILAESTTFKDIKIRYSRSEKDSRLVEKDAVLTLDGTAGKLIVMSAKKQLSIPYENVLRVQFELTTHMRGGTLGQLAGVAGAAVGVPEVGTPIVGAKISDYWCYIEYRDDGGSTQSQMLEVARDISDRVIDAMTQAFGNRAIRVQFAEHADRVDKKTVADLQSKHDVKIDKKNHPLPKVEQGRALIVVVCPRIPTWSKVSGNQFKVHANDRAVIVNKAGTYSFAYLDPGEYMLVSQSENASGFRIKLEAGQEYYFLQNILYGNFKLGTALSRNSKELVMQELTGAYYADWKRNQ